jgi:hypothetical protein
MNRRLLSWALKTVFLTTGLFVLPAIAIEPFVVPDSTQGPGSYGTHFTLELLRGKYRMFFQHCSYLGSESEVVVEWESWQRSTYPGSIRSPHVVCRRRFRDYDTVLAEWQERLHYSPADVLPPEAIITLVSAGQGEVAWWSLEYPWPVRVHFVADGDHLVEEVVIRSHRTTRLPDRPMNW